MNQLTCLTLAISFLFSSCTYRPQQQKGTVSISYFKEDINGSFTQALIQALATSQSFEYKNRNGRLLIEGAVISDTHQTIGYQFDRDPLSEKQINRLTPSEERRTITVEITITDHQVGKIIYGPIQVSASTDYDFSDSDSLRDVSFIDPNQNFVSSLEVSKGQFDSLNGAQDAALHVIYQKLATKIVEGISHLSYDLN